jgi:hypothetical protein
MKKKPKDGGRYQRSVKATKAAANVIAKKVEKQFGLPRGVVRISLTKLPPAVRENIETKFA